MQTVEQSITVWSAFGTAPYTGVKDRQFPPSSWKLKVHTVIIRACTEANPPHLKVEFVKLTVETSRIRFPARARDLFLLRNVQTTCGFHPASFSLRTKHISTGIKRSECGHSSLLLPRLRMSGAMILLFLYTFMARTGKTLLSFYF
jgi:hypothetical protein